LRQRTLALYFSLILLPALLAAAGAIVLLRREQQRLEWQAHAADADRALALATLLRGRIETAQRDLLAELRRAAAGDVSELLSIWQREHPLVRNVFEWNPTHGLTRPPAQGGTREESHFRERYAALFRGEAAWKLPEGEGGTLPTRSAAYRVSRRARDAEPAVDAAGGWLPWFSGRSLYLLGWIEAPDGSRRGVELELAALLARILPETPAPPASGMVYAVLDGSGDVAHQAGGVFDETLAPSRQAVSLAPALPHWQVEVGRVAGAAPGGGSLFLLLSALLAVTCLGAVLSGALLLTREAGRAARDAERKTTFVANVSHELKTPLTALRMHAELVRDGRVRAPDEVRQSLDTVVAESERLTRLVNNVLDFSRLEQGRRRYRLETLDLGERVREAVENQRPRLEAAGLQLRLVLPPEGGPAARADRDAFEQALVNLLDNAAKYAAAGGALEIEAAAGNDGFAEVRVLDRGPGIPAAHRARLFSRFHRVDDSLTARQPGCGLGLAIARGLLRGMGGEALYAPRPGGGSVFTLRLPGGKP
jgi:signal transduction histidine kinase